MHTNILNLANKEGCHILFGTLKNFKDSCTKDNLGLIINWLTFGTIMNKITVLYGANLFLNSLANAIDYCRDVPKYPATGPT